MILGFNPWEGLGLVETTHQSRKRYMICLVSIPERVWVWLRRWDLAGLSNLKFGGFQSLRGFGFGWDGLPTSLLFQLRQCFNPWEGLGLVETIYYLSDAHNRAYVSIPERVWVWLRHSITASFARLKFQSLRGFGFGWDNYIEDIREQAVKVSIPERVWVWLRRKGLNHSPIKKEVVSIPERVWVWLRLTVPSKSRMGAKTVSIPERVWVWLRRYLRSNPFTPNLCFNPWEGLGLVETLQCSWLRTGFS